MKLPLALLACLPLAGAEWALYRSGQFSVYSDAGRGRSQGVLKKLELMRAHLADWGIAPLPVKVFLFGNQKDFRPFRQGTSTRGVFQSGPEADYIILQDSGDAETTRAAAHEYVHLLLHHVAGPLPRWQEEGLAEFHSTARPGMTGELIRGHLQALQRGMLPAKELVMVERDAENPLLYPQSWALVHLLHAFEGDEFKRYVSPPFAGLTAEMAELLMKRLPAYLKRPMQGWRTDVRAVDVEVSAEVLDRKRALLAMADLAFATDRLEYAQELLKGREDDADFAHELGMLALAGRRDALAVERFERAVKLPGARSQSFFELAMLLRDQPEGRARVGGLLEETVGRNPAHGEAHFLLGQMAARQARWLDAIASFERAVAVLPRQSSFWIELALAQHHEGRVMDARRSADRALAAAATEDERKRARAAARLNGEARGFPITISKPSVSVPPGWTAAKGDAVLEGVLHRVICGHPPQVQIWSDGKLHSFRADAMRTMGAAKEFTCGAQAPAPEVRLSYESGTGRAVTMELR